MKTKVRKKAERSREDVDKLVRQKNEKLKQQFNDLKLDLEEVFCPMPDDLARENVIMEDLLKWVAAYCLCPSRYRLESCGYLFPPVDHDLEPDIDPDRDWRRFERWIRRKPVDWNYVEKYGRLTPAASLTEIQIASELSRIEKTLLDHNIQIEIQKGVPLRLVYTYLIKELELKKFEKLEKGTTCHITGCSGVCPGCFQAPWCEISRRKVL